MSPSKIEWADDTLQLTTGCTKTSPGCAHCYAERMHPRLRGMGHPMYQQPFEQVLCWPEQLKKIAKLPKGKRVFVNSMSDLFHKDVSDRFILDAFAAMSQRPDVTFQVLTKRAERLAKGFGAPVILTPNIWLGVTAENQEQADRRIPLLLQIPAAVRFVSIEPMLGPVDLGKAGALWTDMNGNAVSQVGRESVNWVICGGETGPGARPMHPDWVRSLRDQCQAAGVPFFFKGWGEWVSGKFDRRKSKMICDPVTDIETFGCIFWTNPREPKVHLWDEADHYWTNASARIGKKAAGRVLDGRTWEEFPNA